MMMVRYMARYVCCCVAGIAAFGFGAFAGAFLDAIR
jgi:hypothetical protein